MGKCPIKNNEDVDIIACPTEIKKTCSELGKIIVALITQPTLFKSIKRNVSLKIMLLGKNKFSSDIVEREFLYHKDVKDLIKKLDILKSLIGENRDKSATHEDVKIQEAAQEEANPLSIIVRERGQPRKFYKVNSILKHRVEKGTHELLVSTREDNKTTKYWFDLADFA